MSKRDQVLRINIQQIYPSPENPRKQLPRELVAALHNGMEHRAFLEELRCLGNTHAGLAEFLKGLDDLAGSIQQVGQLAPVRVFPQDGKTYLIEMGERRWLSHLILFFERGDAAFEHIDAILNAAQSSSEKALQRRMAENVHRAEFSPIEMARGLAARLDELQRELPEVTLVELQARVGAENGIHARRVRQYLALLTLDEQAQELAEQAHLTERALRGVLKFKTADKQVAAIRRLIHPGGRKNPSKNTVAPKQWAETFVRNVMALEQRGKERAAYARALRVQLKRNPRIRALLGCVLPQNGNRNGKRAASQALEIGKGKSRKLSDSVRRHGIAESPKPVARGGGRRRRSGRSGEQL